MTIIKAAQAVNNWARATLSGDGEIYTVIIETTAISVTVKKNPDTTISFLDENGKKLTQEKLKEYIKKQYDKATTGISVD